VFLGLYPTLLLLNLLLFPVLDGLAVPLKILVSLLFSVPLMVWLVVPVLNRLFLRWLHPDRVACTRQGTPCISEYDSSCRKGFPK
jgi:antibiotic biosynthesis monooxygenase (ABM) superfamily enzyme